MLEKFLAYLKFELNRSPLTAEAYGRDIRQFIEWLSPGKPEEADLTSVTPNDVRSWIASRARQGESNRTTRRKLQSLRAFFKWMQINRMIRQSPLKEVPLPKIAKPLPDFIRSADLEKILETDDISSHDNSNEKEIMENLIVDMLYSLGIRRAELIGINDSDISEEKNEIKVLGKRSKQRVIPVPSVLMQKIIRWQLNRNKLYPDSIKADTPLFMENGHRINPRRVYSIVHAQLSGLAAKKKSPHALRHSFASAMLNGGADLDSVREFLGHSSLATTQIYTHVTLNEIRKAYSKAHPRAETRQK